jgi:hypothetical protein
VQSDAAAELLLYFPAAQSEHARDPFVPLYLPGMQDVQLGTSPLMALDVTLRPTTSTSHKESVRLSPGSTMKT